ncbi:Smr-domain-containing protein [Lactarius vividus]|nr:Smr-domain-containing protein [Lactarius vividus]
MTDAYSQAKSALKMGDHRAAKESRQRGDAHKSLKEKLDKQAANIIFMENNKGRDNGMVDLHGLYVAEAVRFAKEQLRSARLKRDDVVYFIVGKGLHSDTSGAKIRPALEDLCTEQGLDYSLDPNNAGVLVVRLG